MDVAPRKPSLATQKAIAASMSFLLDAWPATKHFTLCAMMAHNLSREIQMLAASTSFRARPKRPAAWNFNTLDTLRHRIIQRAGRLTRPQGKLTLTMSANTSVRKDLLHFLDSVQKSA